MSEAKVVYDPDYGHQVVLAENERYAALTSAGDGARVLCEFIRVVDKKNYGHEVVYWNLEELTKESLGSAEDPTTGLNAALAAIALVAADAFPPPGFEVK